jgi:hypothetical protein
MGVRPFCRFFRGDAALFNLRGGGIATLQKKYKKYFSAPPPYTPKQKSKWILFLGIFQMRLKIAKWSKWKRMMMWWMIICHLSDAHEANCLSSVDNNRSIIALSNRFQRNPKNSFGSVRNEICFGGATF